jgi:hypothetical protein
MLAGVRALDDELVAAGVNLYIDGDVLLRPNDDLLPFLLVYHVERVARFTAAGVDVSALHLRRLDDLNIHPPHLGMTRPELAEALVLVEEAERLAAGALLPALADGAVFRMVEDVGVEFPDRAAVEARAGELARRELRAAVTLDAAALARTARALGRRRDFYERWRSPLERGGFFLAPQGLRLPADFRESLLHRLPVDTLDDLAAAEADLADEDAARVFAGVVAAVVAMTERHEVQHRLDFSIPTRPMPEPLAELEASESARDETSAYLAEVARGGRTPLLGLTLLARALFDPAYWGGAESYAAVVIFGGLAGELGIATKPLIVERRIDRAAAARAYLAVTEQPLDKLQGAAGRLWTRYFERPLPEIVSR